MKLVTVHAFGKESVIIYCPFCGVRKNVSTNIFKNSKHGRTVRCQCGKRFNVLVNFRRKYRKSVEIFGVFTIGSPDMPSEMRMQVSDLSMSGLRFKMIDSVVVKEGDVLFVKFNLDDAKQSFINKKVVVQLVSNDIVGCEFTELSHYEKELGFYLLT